MSTYEYFVCQKRTYISPLGHDVDLPLSIERSLRIALIVMPCLSVSERRNTMSPECLPQYQTADHHLLCPARKVYPVPVSHQ